MLDSAKAFEGDYAFLSNFYFCVIKFDGKDWPTSEHLFQALKTRDKDQQEKIRNCITPGQAKKLGRIVDLREDWDSIKDNVMRLVLRMKFNQNPFLKTKLLETGNEILIEKNYWHDNYWGVCCCDKCSLKKLRQNILGFLLMSLREEFRTEEK